MGSSLFCFVRNKFYHIGKDDTETKQEESEEPVQTYDNSSATPAEYLRYSVDEDGVNNPRSVK